MRSNRNSMISVPEPWRELRVGWRSLRRRPGYALAVVVLLALGTGGIGVGLGIGYTVYLDPLPYPDAERLVFLREGSPRLGSLSVNYRNFLDWQERNRSFAALGFLRTKGLDLEAQEPLRLDADIVSSELFGLLGVEPALGRSFTPAEDAPGERPAVILGHRLWRERFGGDETVLGRQMVLDGRSHTVVGVMPPGFDPLGRGKDLWLPAGLYADAWRGRADHEGHWVVGRLAPGVSLEAARRDMARIGAELEEEHPGANEGIRPRLERLEKVVAGDLRGTAALFLAAMGLVLGITVANLAGLGLADASARRGTLRVRIALGATRGDLARHHAAEALLLSAVGAAAGAWLSWALVQEISRSEILGPLADVAWLNPLTGGVAACVLAALVLMLSVVPVLGHRGADAVRAPDRGVGAWPARRILVVGQIALAFVALVAAGLLWRSLQELHRVDPGFEPAGAVTFKLDLPTEAAVGPEGSRRALAELRGRLEAAPGVEAVGFAQALPLSDDLWKTNFVFDVEPRSTEYALVSPGYFRAMGIRLLSGRTFDGRDRRGSRWTAVIDRTLAERFWPGSDPVGETIGTGPGAPQIEVAGVVESVRSRALAADAPGLVYVPYRQFPGSPETAVFVVRSRGEASGSWGTLRRTVAEILPGRPVYDRMPLGELVDRDLSSARTRSLLAAGAAGLAAVLSMLGLYGLVSFTTRHRTREIGIRMALGSSPRRAAGEVLRGSLRLALLGLLVGVPAAWALGGLLEGLLYGVDAGDPWAYGGSLIATLALAVTGALSPALRAARIDPRRALAAE